jgi:hypothetical protein
MALRTKIRLLLCLRLFLSEIPLSTFAFIPTSRKRRSATASNSWNTRTSGHHGWITLLSAGLTKDHDVQQRLESMTVKELRQLLKESTLNRRGILSQLKRKQDLVEFLNENLEGSEWEAMLNEKTTDTSKEIQDVPKVNSKATVTSKEIKDVPKENTKVSGSRPMSMPAQKSPKDAIFEKVYGLYPPVKEQECTAIGENDVRQMYHPIFTNSKTTDMDVIFVGTASCSPGMTRGVSCTALRLNGNTQRSLHGVPEGTDDSGSSSGGTWLFDCGECTQASTRRLLFHAALFVQMRKFRCWHQSERFSRWRYSSLLILFILMHCSYTFSWLLFVTFTFSSTFFLPYCSCKYNERHPFGQAK